MLRHQTSHLAESVHNWNTEGNKLGDPCRFKAPHGHPKQGSWVDGKLASKAHIHDGKACVDVNAGDAVYKLKLEDVL